MRWRRSVGQRRVRLLLLGERTGRGGACCHEEICCLQYVSKGEM